MVEVVEIDIAAGPFAHGPERALTGAANRLQQPRSGRRPSS